MLIKQSTALQLQHYFILKKWIANDEKITGVSKAGDGNMNCVLRIQTDTRSFICKQSNDYVEKYPQIPAPKNRVQTEAAFYQKILINDKIQSYMPKLLGLDEQNNIMIIEDLGEIKDFSSLYDLNSTLSEFELRSITNYLNQLHQSFTKVQVDDELNNLELRELNYDHIFDYPFKDHNGFDLDAIQLGLQAISIEFKNDLTLKLIINKLGAKYLESGKTLLHGDFYPGSWLNCNGQIKIIDPEFCYFGYAEFDLAVLIAHLHLTKHNGHAIEFVKKAYLNYSFLNHKLLNGFVGTEIVRRLIGLAQLPLKMELSDKIQLLEKAKQLLLTYDD